MKDYLLFILLLFTHLFSQGTLEVGIKASDWELKDADGKLFTMGSWTEKILQINYVDKSHITIRDTFTLNRKSISITRMSLGGEYHLRYVPQSRYFQPHELANHSSDLSADELKKLNSERSLSVEREIKI